MSGPRREPAENFRCHLASVSGSCILVPAWPGRKTADFPLHMTRHSEDSYRQYQNSHPTQYHENPKQHFPE
jgi:hypothetical protein